MIRTLLQTSLLCLALGCAASTAQAKDYSITVHADASDYAQIPVKVMIDAPRDFVGVALMSDGKPVPVQSRLVGKKVEVLWLETGLKKGQSRRYTLAFEKVSRPVPTSGVLIDKNGTNLDIRINQQLFTRYDTTTGPNKPYFYPVIGAENKQIVRHHPLEKYEGETNDHPHHRGMWFTHGEVNGEDFWAEGGKTGKTVHKAYEEIVSGPVCGYFRCTTDWIGKDGKKVAEDVREVAIYNVPDGRLMDFTVTVKATEGPVHFGDTKEGSLGIRIPDSMRQKGGNGHIENSSGLKDGATWGKRAAWVDYYGSTEGAAVGIAIFDHTENLRHPTYWHVRDYGLFAVNPFGIHDFTNDKANPKIGDHVVAKGSTQKFSYRIYFHKGTTADANIAGVWNAFATPPRVEIK